MDETDIDITVNNEPRTSDGTTLEFTGIPKNDKTVGEPEATESNSFIISFSAPVNLSRVEFEVGGGPDFPTNLTVVLKDMNSGLTTTPIAVINGILQVPNSVEVVQRMQIILIASELSQFTLILDFFGCVEPGKTCHLFQISV